ncbi:MAG: hypothetical protein HOO06_09500 [Bdellovibrionaceae bacterium]|jgi:hypothetical protein|nr:hypothetical protein [Pseudobdellovibrionaceae bacterium]
MKITKKEIIILAALGLVPVKEVLASDFENGINLNPDSPSLRAENLQINPDTLRVLKMFSQMNAINFDNDAHKILIKPEQLPNILIIQLHNSKEVEFDEEANVFFLKEEFINTLARDHAFSRLGTVPSIETNKEILKRLKENSTPVLREDQILYSRHSFIR